MRLFYLLSVLLFLSCDKEYPVVRDGYNIDLRCHEEMFLFTQDEFFSPDNYDYLDWGNGQGTDTYASKHGNRITIKSCVFEFCGQFVRICPEGGNLEIEDRACYSVAAIRNQYCEKEGRISFEVPSSATHIITYIQTK